MPKVAEQAKNSTGMSGGKNRQNVIDDGFTFFEANPVTERSEKYRGDVSKGWTMVAHLRAFGNYPKNSGFNVVVSKGGKALSKMYCEGETYRKSEARRKLDELREMKFFSLFTYYLEQR